MKSNPFTLLILSIVLSGMMTGCISTVLHKSNSEWAQKSWLEQKIEQLKATHLKDLKLNEITMTFIGGTTRFPVHTNISLVNYAVPTISYSRKIQVSPAHLEEAKKALRKFRFEKFEKIETTWQSDLLSQDFVNIENKCKSLKLWAKDAVDLLKGVKPIARCANTDDIQLYLKAQNGREKTLKIPGKALCQKQTLLKELANLVGEINALVPKYQPDPEVEYALKAPTTVERGSET
jgi:hypothetical protein